jgi:protein-serine/threonine kinase
MQRGYSRECDWWSVGVIMFEMLVGYPPFCSETPQETYRKIMNFKETLRFPEDALLSPEAQDLIERYGGATQLLWHAQRERERERERERDASDSAVSRLTLYILLATRLLDGQHTRLGANSVEDIKAHPFFAGINWDEIRQAPAPVVPHLISPTDTTHFEEYEEEEESDDDDETHDRAFTGDEHHRPTRRLSAVDLPFIGYTFKSFDAVKARFETINLGNS